MYLRDLTMTLRRRWYLVIVGLIVTAALSLGTYILVPPTYEAKSTVVLVPPAGIVDPAGGNPYLQLGGLGQVADVVTRALNSDHTTEIVKNTSASTTYVIATDPTTSAPVITITVDAASAADAVNATKAILDLVPTTLENLQSSLAIAQAEQVKSVQLSPIDKPTKVGKNQLRAVIAALVLGLVCSALLIALVDTRLRTRADLAMASGTDNPPDKRDRTLPVKAKSNQDGPRSRDSSDDTRRAPKAPRDKQNGLPKGIKVGVSDLAQPTTARK